MWKFIQVVGITGFLICLFIMYMTNLGVRGIRKYDPGFQSPDMQLHYSAASITDTFEKIGANGRAIYRKYLFLDCAFTLFFLIVMVTITGFLFTETLARNLMFAICIFRAIFDILENSLLLIILRNYPVINKPLITICSAFTTIKFVLLYIWILALIFNVILLGFQKLKGV